MKSILAKALKNNIRLYNFVHRSIMYKLYSKYINKKKRVQLKKNGTEILKNLNLAFAELNMPYWLAFGTLLGAVREKNIISHDLDLDIAAWKYSYSNRVAETLSKYGFVLMRTIILEGYLGVEETYSYKGVNVDIFYFEKISDESAKCYVFYMDKSLGYIETITKYGGLFPLEVVLPFNKLSEYTFLGVNVHIPDVYKEQLAFHYGENYMIPNSNWDYTKAPNSKKIEGLVGIVHE